MFLHLVWLVWFVLSVETLVLESGESGLGEVQGGSANHYDRTTCVCIAVSFFVAASFSLQIVVAAGLVVC